MTSSDQPTATYFPLQSDRYEVKAGLHAFGTDFGNDNADRRVFQIDTEYRRYRDAKLAARAEDLAKYYRLDRYSSPVAHTITSFITGRLTQEYPEYFALGNEAQDHTVLRCVLTNEDLVLDADRQLIEVRTQDGPATPAYVSSLDALASQIQEDVAVVTLATDNWLSAIHLCYPNHWAAEDKIGKDFVSIHKPVPGIENISRRATELVEAMIYKGPYVRFVWGLATDSRLNHHPHAPPGTAPERWQGRHFTSAEPRLFLRVERQVLWGFPDVAAALFTIRTYFTDCREIKKDSDRVRKLASAIRSMTPPVLAYKGLADSRDDVLSWLRENP